MEIPTGTTIGTPTRRLNIFFIFCSKREVKMPLPPGFDHHKVELFVDDDNNATVMDSDGNLKRLTLGGVTWEDVGSGAQTIKLPSFALTGSNPASTVGWGDDVALDFAGGSGDVHFSTTDDTTFDVHLGQARILVPGMYQIRCQVNIRPTGDIAADARAQLTLRYDPVWGGSIEIPYYIGYVQPGGGEQALDGDQFVYPAGTGGSYDIGLERLHPISLTSDASFPVSIQPRLYWTATSDPTEDLVGSWLGLWGFRIGDNLDAYHSN